MKQEINFPVNHYLNDIDRKKKKSAYYGEFFVNKEFDDGWRENLQKRFKIYCENFENSNLDLEVFDEMENISGNIKLILSVDEIIGDSEKDILDTTTKLQREFLLTPIFQNTNFGFSDDSILPVVLEKPKEDSKNYPRFALQKVISEILFLEGEIKRFEYLTNIFLETDGEIRKAQLIQINDLINQYLKNIENELIPEKNKIIENFYFLNALKPFGNTRKTNISNTQADAVIDLLEVNPKENGLRILSWMKQMEKSYQLNIESSKKLEEKFEFQTKQIFSSIEELIGSAGLEVQSKNGILTDFELEHGRLVKAKIVGFKKSEVYFLSGILYGLEIDGITEDIKEIKVENCDSSYIYSFFINLSNGKKIFCFSDKDKYKVLELDGKREFKYFKNLYYDDNKLTNGEIINEDGNESCFYLENGEYNILNINGETEFKSLYYLKTENNVPIGGKIELKNGKYGYLINKEGKYDFLELYGQKEFKNITKIDSNNNERLFYNIKLDDNNHKYFYLENGKYIALEIEGQTEFDEIVKTRIEDGVLIYGIVGLEDGSTKYFYLENGKYKYLSLDGIENISSTNYYNIASKDGKATSGEIELENGNEVYFYLKDSEYLALEINGLKEFSSINIDSRIDGKMEIGYVKLENGLVNYVYLKNGEYSVLEVGGQTDFYHIKIYEFNNGNILYGKVQLSNDIHKYFYLENGKYKFLGIEGQTEFSEIDDLNFVDGIITTGRIKNKNGDLNYFYLNGGKYSILEVEGKKDFMKLSDIYFDNGKLISAKVMLKPNKFAFFYLENENYKFIGSIFNKSFYRIYIKESGINFRIDTSSNEKSDGKSDYITYSMLDGIITKS